MPEPDPLNRAKEPITPLAGCYGHPVHPMLVPIPIGCWITSFGLDLLNSLLGDHAVLAESSALLLGVGVLGALAAGGVGFLDLVALPPGTRVFRIGLVHMSLNLLVTSVFALSLWLRWYQGVPSPTTPLPLLLSAAGVAGLLVSAWLGGQLAFRYGVRVASEDRQREGYE